MFNAARMNTFLSSVKESMDSANTAVNAKLNEGIEAALKNEKVKNATTYIQQSIPLPALAPKNEETNGKPQATTNDAATEHPSLLDLDGDAHVEVEDWSSSSSTLATTTTTTTTAATSTAPVVGNTSSVLTVADSTAGSTTGTTAAGGSIQASNIVECGDCKTLITINSLLDKFNPNKNYHHCRMCAKVFCLSCIAKSSLPVPFDLLHPTYQEQYIEVSGGNTSGGMAWLSKLAASTTSTIGGLSGAKASDDSSTSTAEATTTTTVVTTNTEIVTTNGPASTTPSTTTEAPTTTTINKYKEDKQYVCNKKCLCHLQTICMENFRNEMMDKFGSNITTYLAKPFALKKHSQFFPIPSGIMEDDAYRRALRFAHIADAVGSYTGLSFYIKAAKYAYMGTELVNMIIGSELYPVLLPMLDNLKTYGITGPTALLCIYYLGCQHTLRYKDNLNTMKQSILYDSTQVIDGVLASECPLHVLEYIAKFISPAQWLYTAVLPPPHDNNDWSSWYLSNMIKHQGWSLLMNINDTTKLPDGKKCPAFAIVVRTERDPLTKAVLKKEAMLVIRGSQSTMDWSINFEEELMEMCFSYRSTSMLPPPANLQHVIGFAHKGIYNGALGILDGYGARVFLMLLFNSGYHIQVVGHSLGAGVASLIAADLRSSIVQSQEKDREMNAMNVMNVSMKNNSSSSTAMNANAKALEAHRISAIVFSCPAIVTENLAVAFVEDRLLINVVNGPDAIPRFSRYTMKALAKEMDNFKGQAEIWTLQDKKDITSYIKKMGKASDIHHATSQERTTARYLKLFQKKNNDGSGGGGGSDDEDDTISGHSNHSAGSSAISTTSGTTGGNSVVGGINVSHLQSEAEKGIKHIEQTFRTMIRRTSVTATNTASTTTTPTPAAITDGNEVAVTTAENETSASSTTSGSVLTGLASKNAALWSAMTNFASSTSASLPTPATAEPVPVATATAAPPVPPKPPKPLPAVPSAPSAPPLIDLTGDSPVKPSAPPAAAFDTTPSAPAMVTFAPNTANALPVDPFTAASSTAANNDDFIRTVTPGPIVHLYKENDGSMKAAVITHQHPTFQHIELLLEQLLEDHAVKTYRQSLDCVLFHARRAAARQQRQGTISSPTTTHDLDHLFPMHVSSADTTTPSDKSFAYSTSSGRTMMMDGDGEEDDDDDEPLQDVTLASSAASTKKKEDRSILRGGKLLTAATFSSNGNTTTEIMDVGSMKVEKALAPGYICAWTPCSICQLDVTWPYIMHSDASRGMVKNYCASCHNVVCNFCAPAGDELPGDGVNQKVSLPDYRMTLPWTGIYTAQRVCIHCYFNSTYPGLDQEEK